MKNRHLILILLLFFLAGCKTPPVASFTFSPADPEIGENVIFTNTSKDANSFSWDFGDGASSTSENASHTYSGAGNFAVELTATGEDGSDSYMLSVPIGWPDPIADFSMNKSMVVPSETVTFTNASQWAESYSWDFGDGSTSTVTDPTHSYTSEGIYTVTLTAIGYNAGTDMYSMAVNVCYPPEADFTMDRSEAHAGETITFTNQSQHATSYLWDFGDGTTSTSSSVNVPHNWSDGGVFAVQLTATGNCGSDTHSDEVTIIAPNIFPGVGIMDMELEDTWGVISTQLDDWMYLGWGYLGDYILHLVESPSTDVLGFFLSVATSSTMSTSDVCIQLNAQENFVGETPEGIMVGSTLAEVEAAYGPPLTHDTDRDYYRYNTIGLGFFYNPSTLEVEIIATYPPYTKKSTNHIHQIIDTLPLRDLDFQR